MTFELKHYQMKKGFLLLIMLMILFGLQAQNRLRIVPGAERMELYLPLLKGKSIAIFANATSMVGQKHLVDTLLKKGITVKKIFSPEHGFRGNADAGEKVESSVDPATGIPIISLYGKHNKPSANELQDVDILLFDIQDVGCRFYTYINSLQHYIEAAIENGKPLLLLDRPNPNGFYVDGPILQPGFTSGVGVQPIPVVYGMTEGEYARMLLGEKLLDKNLTDTSYAKVAKQNILTANRFSLQIIACKNYDHTMTYELPVRPSPNLPNQQSVLLYPSTCFFEGTDLSLGRGTDKPFQVWGHPSLPDTLFSFKPASLPGAKNPPLLGKTCYGFDLSSLPIDITQKKDQQINLSYLLKAYKMFPNKDSFFLRPAKGNPATSDYFFNKLAGNDKLMWQILNGKSEAEIRQSWAADIAAFKKVRKKYLLYGEAPPTPPKEGL